ncbi:hypothetical protein PR048_009983 [Dryococelus australis]|uniref:Endonuclease/exonuclease/phosphatase domain-containing protein n=1 Tax=Dryococelus australis TaxID=614101 RepID=A0ABQ9I1F4_9NEOP|nr:hypothetical protein PR048_009983 [Dryococelus australis]
MGPSTWQVRNKRNHEECREKIDHKKTPQLATEEESSRKHDNIEEHQAIPAEMNRKPPPIIITRNHHSHLCPRNIDSIVPIKCTNCGESHSAGDRNCRISQGEINKQEEDNNQHKTKNIQAKAEAKPTSKKKEEIILWELIKSIYSPTKNNCLKKRSPKAHKNIARNATWQLNQKMEESILRTRHAKRQPAESEDEKIDFESTEESTINQDNTPRRNEQQQQKKHIRRTLNTGKNPHQHIIGSLNNQMPQTQEKEIKILLWNANGIKTKDYEFQRFLEEAAIEIALITETKIACKARYKLPRHVAYRTDRHEKGVTTQIGINKVIMHTPIGSQQDSTTITIPTPIGEMAIAAIYSPPDNNLKENLEAIFQKAPNFIIAGDLNRKSPAWGCK